MTVIVDITDAIAIAVSQRDAVIMARDFLSNKTLYEVGTSGALVFIVNVPNTAR